MQFMHLTCRTPSLSQAPLKRAQDTISTKRWHVARGTESCQPREHVADGGCITPLLASPGSVVRPSVPWEKIRMQNFKQFSLTAYLFYTIVKLKNG